MICTMRERLNRLFKRDPSLKPPNESINPELDEAILCHWLLKYAGHDLVLVRSRDQDKNVTWCVVWEIEFWEKGFLHTEHQFNPSDPKVLICLGHYWSKVRTPVFKKQVLALLHFHELRVGLIPVDEVLPDEVQPIHRVQRRGEWVESDQLADC